MGVGLMIKSLIFRVIFCYSLLHIGTANAAETLIAVASNFAKPMQKIILSFEAQSPHKVNMSAGSSGKIYQQIKHGAPFDVFFSADQEKPLKLIEQAIAVKDSLYTYAIGSLVIWTPDQQKRREKAVKGVRPNVAIANPKTAPYGAAAVEALKNMGLLTAYKDQLVYGENISQTYQFVASGAAEFGIVAQSQVIDEPKGTYEIVPTDMYQPIKQDMVVLKHAQDNSAVQDFVKFMHGKKAKDILQSFGYK